MCKIYERDAKSRMRNATAPARHRVALGAWSWRARDEALSSY